VCSVERSAADESDGPGDQTSSARAQSVSGHRSTYHDSVVDLVLGRFIDAERLHRVLGGTSPSVARPRAAVHAPETVPGGRGGRSSGGRAGGGHLPRSGPAAGRGRARREDDDLLVSEDGRARDRRQPSVAESRSDQQRTAQDHRRRTLPAGYCGLPSVTATSQ